MYYNLFMKNIRSIDKNEFVKKVRDACIDICINAPLKLTADLVKAQQNENSELAKEVLNQIVENHKVAKACNMPMCQDTGTVVVFAKVGNRAFIDGNIYDWINEGVRKGYVDGYLRKSMVRHPIDRVNTNDNTPAIIHVELVEGDMVELEIAAKGGGSENMSLVKMLTPAEGIEGVKKLVVDTIFNAGGKPCPPIIVGIGLGGNLERSAQLAKHALFRGYDNRSEDPLLKKLELELIDLINATGVGPMGLGGKTTTLGVLIESAPCHIASLPVAINIQCHADRHTKVVI